VLGLGFLPGDDFSQAFAVNGATVTSAVGVGNVPSNWQIVGTSVAVEIVRVARRQREARDPTSAAMERGTFCGATTTAGVLPCG
jgi:hypothetical protein